MSGGLDTQVVSVNIGALTNATRPLFRMPSLGGGCTILAGHVVQGGSTNSSLRLLKGAVSGGTFTVSGTIDSAAVGGTASPFAANVAKSWAISTSYVAGGEWLAVIEGNVAACDAVAIADIEFCVGVSGG